jgi:splicing factor 1
MILTKYQAASVPEQDNALKRHQLRLLATLNGTLRGKFKLSLFAFLDSTQFLTNADDENQACQNCEHIPLS